MVRIIYSYIIEIKAFHNLIIILFFSISFIGKKTIIFGFKFNPKKIILFVGIFIKIPPTEYIFWNISIKTSKVDTLEPITSKEVTHGLTDSGLDTKEPIENTDKSSSQNEYNTQKISSSDIEKTDYASTKTSIIDNKGQTGISSSINDKEQITNVPSNKDITE